MKRMRGICRKTHHHANSNYYSLHPRKSQLGSCKDPARLPSRPRGLEKYHPAIDIIQSQLKGKRMDPITTAILAAIAAGALSGATKVGEQVIVAAYAKLKDLLNTKFGARSKVVKAVKDLEANPNSAARKQVVKEEMVAAKADKDAHLLKLAQQLLKAVKAQPGGEQIIQTAIGDQNIQVAGDGNTVNVNTPKTKK
jgi:hypothetical protein